jgi:hypothetical protein
MTHCACSDKNPTSTFTLRNCYMAFSGLIGIQDATTRPSASIPSSPRKRAPDPNAASMAAANAAAAANVGTGDELSSVLVERINALQSVVSNRLYGAGFDIDPKGATRYADIESEFMANNTGVAALLGYGLSGLGVSKPVGRTSSALARDKTGKKVKQVASKAKLAVADDGDSAASSAEDGEGGADDDNFGAELRADLRPSSPSEVSRLDSRAQTLRRPILITPSGRVAMGAETTYELRRRREAKVQETKLKQLAAENMSRFVDSFHFNTALSTQTISLPVEAAARYTATRIKPPYHARSFARQYLTDPIYDLILDCFWYVHCSMFVMDSKYAQELLLQSLAMHLIRLLQADPGDKSAVETMALHESDDVTPLSPSEAIAAASHAKAKEEALLYSAMANNMRAGGNGIGNRFAFVDTLPFAIADTVFQLFFYFVAGSRSYYTSKFQLECYLIICRVLTGVEIAPVTAVVQQERLFPTEVVAPREEKDTIPSLMTTTEAVSAIERRAIQAAAYRRTRSKSPRPAAAVPAAPTSPNEVVAVDDSLETKELMQLAKSLGYRTVYELYKVRNLPPSRGIVHVPQPCTSNMIYICVVFIVQTTSENDRDILGSHDAYVAETLRALNKRDVLPVTVFQAARAAKTLRESRNRQGSVVSLSTTANSHIGGREDWLVASPRSGADMDRSLSPDAASMTGITTTPQKRGGFLSPLVSKKYGTGSLSAALRDSTDVISSSLGPTAARIEARLAQSQPALNMSPIPMTGHSRSTPSLHMAPKPSRRASQADAEVSAITEAEGQSTHVPLEELPLHKRPMGPEELATRLVRHHLLSFKHSVELTMLSLIVQLVNRSKKRPLSIPFVYTSTSSLFSRVLPEARAFTSGGQLAVNRTIPVSWSKYVVILAWLMCVVAYT